MSTKLIGACGHIPLPGQLSSLLNPLPDQLSRLSPYMGIEIEIEQCPNCLNINDGASWQVVHDSSLKLEASYEVRSAQPTPASVIRARLPVIYQAIKSQLLPQSDRAGIHVHYNVLNMTEQQLRHTVCTFLLAERIIFAYLPEHRRTSIFTTPVYSSLQLQEFALAMMSYLKDVMDNDYPLTEHAASTFWARYGEYVRARKMYSSLNLAAILNKGTVELRLFNSSHDLDDWLFALSITEWIHSSFLFWNNPTTPQMAYKYLRESASAVFGFDGFITDVDDAYSFVKDAWGYVQPIAENWEFPYKREFNASALIPKAAHRAYEPVLSNFRSALKE